MLDFMSFPVHQAQRLLVGEEWHCGAPPCKATFWERHVGTSYPEAVGSLLAVSSSAHPSKHLHNVPSPPPHKQADHEHQPKPSK